MSNFESILQKEFRAIQNDPPPGVRACPSDGSLLEWHFVLTGAEGTDYAGGQYWGRLRFPPEYPFKPPSLSVLTPSGRFAPGAAICMSMTDYHPENWNPLWSVSSILHGLLSFMAEDHTTAGSVASPPAHRRALAASSRAFNARQPAFRGAFPDLAAAAGVAESVGAAATAGVGGGRGILAALQAGLGLRGAAVGGAAAPVGPGGGGEAAAPRAGELPFVAWVMLAATLALMALPVMGW